MSTPSSPDAVREPTRRASATRPQDQAPGDGRHARARATQERLRNVAMEMFALHGFSACSLEDVAERAGTSKGTIFYNFGSKDGLGAAVVHTAGQQVAQAITDSRTGHEGQAAMDAIARGIAAMATTCPQALKVINGELFRNDRPWEADLHEVRETMVLPLHEVAAEMRAELPDERRTYEELLRDPTTEQTAISHLGAMMYAALDRLVYQPDGSPAASRVRILPVT